MGSSSATQTPVAGITTSPNRAGGYDSGPPKDIPRGPVCATR